MELSSKTKGIVAIQEFQGKGKNAFRNYVFDCEIKIAAFSMTN